MSQMQHIQHSLLLILLVAMGNSLSLIHGADDPENFYPEKLIAPLPGGALGRPFGESVVIQGKVIEGPFKYESSLNEGRLLVERINGVATQQGLVMRFSPITPREWWHELDHPRNEALWKAEETKLKTMKGKTFEMRGYERGEHVGVSEEESVIQIPTQSRPFGFRLSFRPLMMKPIPEIHFAPADFINRVAEFEGVAETRSGMGWIIGSKGWTMQVRATAWPADFENRQIIVNGRVVKSSSEGLRLEEADSRLLRLTDQLGKEVKLDGVAWSLNDYWWFEYRGEKLYVENQKGLPGWTNALWGRVITISGVLDRAKLPDLEQISLTQDRDLREYYIVRRASWSPLDQAWRRPPEVPQSPRLTAEYLKSCGIKLDEALQKRFDEWSKETDR